MMRSNAESLWNDSNYELPVDRYVSAHDRTSASRGVGGICAGLREVDEQGSARHFLNCEPGFFDSQEDRVEPATNAFTLAEV